MIRLKDHQIKALPNIHNGCILCGGVGSGKSITSLSFYYLENGGDMRSLTGGKFVPMEGIIPDLYIITTARKRDDCEWEIELARFLLSTQPKMNHYHNRVVVDSWNNIEKYKDVTNAFFIFDEQRVVGYGKWAQTFIDIAKHNTWLLCSATPADDWPDYIAVFIANGFFKNKAQFNREHVIYRPFTKFPQIDRFVNVERLIRLRDRILVDMEFQRSTIRHEQDCWCAYDIPRYKLTVAERINPDTNEPIMNVSEFCQTLRRIVNSDSSRIQTVMDICLVNPKAIVFYNYDYERDILKGAPWPGDVAIAEWNGHAHQPIPETDKWVYLVQYTAGAEGWNCIKTNCIIFYSQTYSYRTLEQSEGRIDRLNTPYTDLYYYHLKSKAPIDMAISRTLKNKKRFNETKFISSFAERKENHEKVQAFYGKAKYGQSRPEAC